MTNQTVNYTPEQTAQLVANYKAGATVEALATMFGKTTAPSSLLEDPSFHSFKGLVKKTGIGEKHETASK